MSYKTTANTTPVSPTRVRIVQASGRTLADIYPGATPYPLCDPHPEHIGKEGQLVCEVGDLALRIRLDDGTELEGCDCWWEYA